MWYVKEWGVIHTIVKTDDVYGYGCTTCSLSLTHDCLLRHQHYGTCRHESTAPFDAKIPRCPPPPGRDP